MPPEDLYLLPGSDFSNSSLQGDSHFDPGQQKDTARLSNDGVVHVSPTAAYGEYSLQIIVKDHAAGKTPRVATQWIDFEVIE